MNFDFSEDQQLLRDQAERFLSERDAVGRSRKHLDAGGGFDADMRQSSTNAPIQNEANNGLKNDSGAIAMARTMDPHSATAQFFINVSDNDFLNFSGENMQGWGYAVFGRVVEGEDVLDKIRVVPTGSQAGHQDVPNDPIVIESVAVLSDES